MCVWVHTHVCQHSSMAVRRSVAVLLMTRSHAENGVISRRWTSRSCGYGCQQPQLARVRVFSSTPTRGRAHAGEGGVTREHDQRSHMRL